VIEVWYHPSEGKVYVSTYDNGNWHTSSNVISVTFAAGDRFGARATSNGVVEVYKNSTLVGSINGVTAFANVGGKIGLKMVNAPATLLDDFGGGTQNVCTSGQSSGGITPNSACQSPPTSGNGLRGDYYNGINFNTYVTTRFEDVNFGWGGGSPDPGVDVDNFSVLWSGQIWVDAPDRHICSYSDDGERIWIDNQLLIDNWAPQQANLFCAETTFSVGYHSIKVAYYELTGDATVKLEWQGSNPGAQPVPIALLSAATGMLPPIPPSVPPQPPSTQPPVPIPFTTARLKDIALNNPQIIWGNTTPPAYGTINWNRSVGRFFQTAVLRAIGVQENGGNFPSQARNNALFPAPGKDVRPDGLIDVQLIRHEENGTISSLFYPASAFVEVKAVNRAINLAYESYQLTGFIDASRSANTGFGSAQNAGVVSYIATANTTMGTNAIDFYRILAYADTNRVALCYAIVWEIPNNSDPYNPQIVVGLNSFLNPEVNAVISPLEIQGCPVYSINPILLSSVNNLAPIPNDPDPAELQE